MIELYMPVMRPKFALRVINDLKNQTKFIDKLVVVDNGGNFVIKESYPFNIRKITPSQNIGTNAVWNMMFKSKADYVGVIGDDYRLENSVISKLVRGFRVFPQAGATTATIFKDREIVLDAGSIKGGKVVARGHMAVTLFKKCTLLCLPLIPKKLFIFYGDNWFGYWLNQLGNPLYEINTGVSHYHKTDLKDKVGYSFFKRKEKTIWEAWKANKIEL